MSVSLLAGLVKGYADETARVQREDFEQRKAQRDAQLQYLGQLASNPNVPVEHQQWALSKIQEGLQHDLSKGKPWKVDLSELPPVMQKQPDQQAVSQAVGGPLQAPAPPPGSSAGVGAASNGTVNALGATKMTPTMNSGVVPTRAIQFPQPPVGIPSAAAVPSVGMNPGGAAPAPMNVPPAPASVISNPTPPTMISPGGAVHLTTPAERLSQSSALQQQQLNDLQRRFPTRSLEDLTHYAQHGEFPKPESFTLGTGQARYNAKGEEIARNDEAKPGAAKPDKGLIVVPGPAGNPIGVRHVGGGELTPEEIAADPRAKAMLDAANKAHASQLDEANRKQMQVFAQQARMLEQGFQNAMQRSDHTAAVKQVDDAFRASNEDSNRLAIMEQNLAKAKQGDQQAMLSLVANHIGMTLGAQKGARINQAVWNEAIASTPWLDKVAAKFDSRGYLSGVTLAPEQMDSMVDLAKDKATVSKNSYKNVKEHYSDEVSAGGRKRGSQKVKQPEAPPATTPAAAGFNWNDHPVVPGAPR